MEIYPAGNHKIFLAQLTGGGKHDEDVHVGSAVLQGFNGGDVEVHAAEELWMRKKRCSNEQSNRYPLVKS